MKDLIQSVARFLYDRGREQLVRLPQIYAAFPNREAADIDEVLNLMLTHGLIQATFQRDAVRLSPAGVIAVSDDCTVELAQGEQYIADRSGPATVHIIVRGRDLEEAGGSGFFSADYPGWIITAAHVIRNRQIIRIENSAHQAIVIGDQRVIVGPDDLDLGLIRCDPPEAVAPIRIEWRADFVRPLQELLILGYPPYPNRLPALHHSRAELHAVTKHFNSERDSLIISSITRPGFSGGPVLSDRGFAIGIVEQENAIRSDHPVAYFSATPTRYCRELDIGPI